MELWWALDAHKESVLGENTYPKSRGRKWDRCLNLTLGKKE